MECTDRPMTQSLPYRGEPKIFDGTMVDHSENQEYRYEEPTNTSILEHAYQDYFRPPTKFMGSNAGVVDPKALDLGASYQSPDASPVSSSDFSVNQHHRHRSSTSSITDNASTSQGKASENIPVAGQENENLFMESAFDFENASISPTAGIDAPLPSKLPLLFNAKRGLVGINNGVDVDGHCRFGLLESKEEVPHSAPLVAHAKPSHIVETSLEDRLTRLGFRICAIQNLYQKWITGTTQVFQ